MSARAPHRSPSYRSLAAVTGPGFLVLSFLARLPVAMAPLGTIMLVVAVTGSYTEAGLATAALGIGAALGGPVVGRLTDRHGQRSIGLAAAIVDGLALAALLVAALAGAGLATVIPLAAVVGLATPQIGPLVRVRWTAILAARGQDHLVPTAMSYEGAADEASFVAGPALVGVLALTGVTALPMLVAIALMSTAILFARHRTASAVVMSRPVSAIAKRRPVSMVVPAGALAVLVAGMVGIGIVFGATETGVAAYAGSIGHGAVAGLIYAVLGVGSVIAGLATVWLPARFRLTLRFPVFAGTLLIGTLALLTIRSTGTAVVAMAAMGVTAAPFLITGYALAERITPVSHAGTTMTLLASGTVGGVALGAGVAGPLAESYGYPVAFVVPIVAAFATVVVTLLGMSRVRAVESARRRQAGAGRILDLVADGDPGPGYPHPPETDRAHDAVEVEAAPTRRELRQLHADRALDPASQ